LLSVVVGLFGAMAALLLFGLALFGFIADIPDIQIFKQYRNLGLRR
jgi:hypothetical protein